MKRPPIELDCLEVWRHLSQFIEQELDPSLRAAMENHFKNCAHCTAILDGSKNVVELCADGKSFALPAKTSARLYGKLNLFLRDQKKKKQSL